MLDGFTESSQYQGLLDESYQVNDDEVNQFDKLTTDNTVILNLFFDADADADADADVINNKAIIEGRINESTTVNGTKVVSNFALVEAKELITSHDALGVANPDFPQELQPRDRSDKKSVDAIKLNAKNLQPEKLGGTEYAGNGAPIIGDDFLVESGNGRAIAIKSAYDNGDAGKYKEWLVNNATDFGLSADDVNGYNQPVLVRVRKTEIDRVEFAIEANLDANPSPLDDDDLTDAPASDDNSELSEQLADLESAVNAEGFNPADFDTKGFIELVTATADDAELTARVMAISSVYQQKLVAASMAAMTSLAGGA